MSFSLDQLLFFAARAGNCALAAERLTQGANPNYVDSVHGSAAREAVRRGDAEMLSVLLDAGLAPDSPASLDGNGLVENALYHRQENIAVLLTDRGFRLRPHARPVYRDRLQSLLADRSRVEPSRRSEPGDELHGGVPRQSRGVADARPLERYAP